jgi:hypothetical protein
MPEGVVINWACPISLGLSWQDVQAAVVGALSKLVPVWQVLQFVITPGNTTSLKSTGVRP